MKLIHLAVMAMLMMFASSSAVGQTGQQANGDPEAALVSALLKNKCADCHAPSLVKYPVFARVPGAKRVMTKNVKLAQDRFELTEAQVALKQPLTQLQLAMFESVLLDGRMPPAAYKALNRGKSIGAAERKAALSWIRKQLRP